MFPSGTITLSASNVLHQCARGAMVPRLTADLVCEITEVLTAVGRNCSVFWDVTSCSLVQVYRRLGGCTVSRLEEEFEQSTSKNQATYSSYITDRAAWCSGNASRSTRFEYRRVHRLSCTDRCRDSTSIRLQPHPSKPFPVHPFDAMYSSY